MTLRIHGAGDATLSLVFVISHLIGQAVKRSRQAAHAGAEGEVWVAECTAHKMARVRADVAAFVVTAQQRKRHENETIAW